MSHIDGDHLHGYASRGLDLRVSITTEENHTDFTSITFRIGTAVEKTGLDATDTATGFNVDFTLTASDMDLTPDVYRWELVATFVSEVRTLAQGRFTVDPEPTVAPESP